MCNKSQTTTIGKIAFFLVVSIILEVNGQDNPQVNITWVNDAVAKGAVCLDGSPAAYYFSKGFDDGASNWVIYLPGGGWCGSKDECLQRLVAFNGYGGSTKSAPSSKDMYPILSSSTLINPDFYNWNRVFIRYCDGASFMADVEAVDPETKLHFRGRRIFNTVMEELIANHGMANASNALLVGDSAGGLATILNCDRFRSFFTNEACRVKCISDSGFFIHAKDLPGVTYREEFFASVIALHEIAEFLPKSCTSRMAPNLCFFPENLVGDIKTPLFLLNSDVDRYQISTLLVPNNIPAEKEGWEICTHNFTNLQKCTTNQNNLITEFHTAFHKTLEGLADNPSRGSFIAPCYIHDFIYNPLNWDGIPTLENKTIRQALGDWYFERSNIKLINTQYSHPLDCNETRP